MDKTEIKKMIEWMEEKGHTDEEILDCIRRMVDAKPRKAEKKTRASAKKTKETKK